MNTAVVDFLKTAVPGIATALGGPLAGMATAWIANRMGLEAKTVESVTDAIRGVDPLERAKLENEFNRWYIEQQQKELQMYMVDVQDARKRDATLNAVGNKNTRADTMYVLAIVVIVGIVWSIWSKQELNEYVKGIMTLVLGRFLGYLDNIYNFEFGSTRASKSKDETISKLSERA